MPLHLTLAAAEGLPESTARWIADHREIVVESSGTSSGSVLATWLQDQLGSSQLVLSIGGEPLEGLRTHSFPLVNGAVVVCSVAAAFRPRHRSSISDPRGAGVASGGAAGITLAVTGGPDSGRIFELPRGNHSIGREGCAVGIDDPALSRKHAVLSITEREICITDLGSANGIEVDGNARKSSALTSGMGIGAGNSRLSLWVGSEPPEALTPDEDLAAPVPVNARAPEGRGKMTLLLAGLPLVAGVALAVLTGMWFFLAFSGLSLLTAAIPYAAGKSQRKRFKAAVDRAVAHDAVRRFLSAPDPARLLYGVLLGEPLPVTPARPEHLWLRLGTAEDTPKIEFPAGTDNRELPALPGLPVAFDLMAERSIVFRGSNGALHRMLNSCLLQLGARALRSRFRVICFGDPQSLPAAARFLPSTALCSRPGALAELLGSAPDEAVVLIVGRPDEAESVLEGLENPPAVLWFAGGADVGLRIELSFQQGLLHEGSDRRGFVPDLVSDQTLERFARLSAAAVPSGTDAVLAGLPDMCALESLLPRTSTGPRWAVNASVHGLRAVLGVGEYGPLELDLTVDGPHLLVAGTTGSGKSELLRSLVLGLAHRHPPQKVHFLLVDFKGGAGLGLLSDLPHSIGLLTDLSAENVNRALLWLRAEVQRRETELAGLGATDISECRPGVLPRLVVVIDEFRMLADEVPRAVPELMRIAALGRSLGVHLVMATQRPQGAITSDIRANVTTAIALRVQTALESSDVIDSPAAAAIDVGSPGRAFLRTGSGAPYEFQSASATVRSIGTDFLAMSLEDWLERGNDLPTEDGEGNVACRQTWSPALDPAKALVEELRGAAAATQLPEPLRQLTPPLPDVIVPEDLVSGNAGTGAVDLGLLDLPEEQCQRVLRWHPEKDGHLAIVGVDGSGALELVCALSASLLAGDPERHCYVLDGDGSLVALAGAGRTGAYTGPQDVERAARLLRKLADVVADRLGRLSAAAPIGSRPAPIPLVVLVTGWGRWASAFRNSRLAWAEECVQDIARDGARTSVILVMSGERELMTGRYFGLLGNKLFLPAGSSPENLMSWPKLPPMEFVAGRAMVQGRIGAKSPAVAQLLSAGVRLPPLPPRSRPFKVEPLPACIGLSCLPEAILPDDKHLVIGVEGDELEASFVKIVPGEALLVLGRAGSGKTNLLQVLNRQSTGQFRCHWPPAGIEPERFWEELDIGGPGALMLVDDAHRLGPTAQRRLTELVAAGAAAVVTAVPGPTLLQQVPLASAARVTGTGMVLSPQSPSDGDFFGIRLDQSQSPPGRAWSIQSGRNVTLQIAFAD
ncbi:FtsK/SpoIIIE domain-containing protein [Arthrobacter sp. VKM Ac-2550]|uniref:FtsK/SpoIIIE domain-containing protein n=1 Tax=Crystallibacter permensis TaxID=1938888 RepID=UPI002225D9D9|nr:FtsK/SpoIIIE domain-containing protein [Arthrobacter sp. VKM Ac-2550]MCW2132740.1 DNA segregation ATPase FtsK/SpoIIIE, S-DNA-T family [Arthrobacter sp. VKM Ac-2550]